MFNEMALLHNADLKEQFSGSFFIGAQNKTFSRMFMLLFYIQWGKKVFSQPPIVQVLPLKKMREACNFHHRYTSTMRDKIRK